MSMVPPWPAAKVETIPATKAVIDALGDPTGKQFPCMCDDCVSRGVVVPNTYEDERNMEETLWPW